MNTNNIMHWYSKQTVIIGKAVNPADYCKKKIPSITDIKNITDALVNALSECQATDPVINALEK